MPDAAVAEGVAVAVAVPLTAGVVQPARALQGVMVGAGVAVGVGWLPPSTGADWPPKPPPLPLVVTDVRLPAASNVLANPRRVPSGPAWTMLVSRPAASYVEVEVSPPGRVIVVRRPSAS